MQQAYDIVFTGRLRPGTRPDDALDSLSKQFAIGPDTASAMLRAAQEIVIRKSVPSREAYRMKEALEACGMEVRLNALHDLVDGEEPSLELVPKGTDEDSDQDHRAAGQHLHRTGVQCPKCGTKQAHARACVKCGLIFEKYYQHKAKPAPAGDTSARVSAARAAARKTAARRRKSALMNVALAVVVLCIVGALGYVYYSGYQF